VSNPDHHKIIREYPLAAGWRVVLKVYEGDALKVDPDPQPVAALARLLTWPCRSSRPLCDGYGCPAPTSPTIHDYEWWPVWAMGLSYVGDRMLCDKSDEVIGWLGPGQELDMKYWTNVLDNDHAPSPPKPTC
jgi:hypothetical protein